MKGVNRGRFSGAGFMGAVIALVDPIEKENIETALTKQYLEKFPKYEHTCEFFGVKPDEGARFI